MHEMLYIMIDCILFIFIARIYYRMQYTVSLHKILCIIGEIIMLISVYCYFQFDDVLVLIPCLFLYILLDERVYKKIIILIFIYVYILFIQLLCINILCIDYTVYIYEQHLSIRFFILLVHILILSIVHNFKLYNKLFMQKEELVVFILFCLLQLVINTVYDNISQIFISIASCLILLSYKIYKYKKDQELKQKEIMKDNMIKRQEERFYELEKQYEDVRRFQHDFQHHMNVTNNINSNQLNTYANTLMKEYENLKVQQCGNIYVDAIIKEYVKKCREKEIVFHYHFSVIGVIDIEPTDLTILLSNLLQNAVEATDKIDNYEKRINLIIYNVKYHFAVDIENTVNESFDINYIKYKKSSKCDKDKHGYGLRTIQHIINKYDGDFIIESYNYNVKLKIILQGVVSE